MKQNVLVIGGGGREHAICAKLYESNRVGRIYAAPGNAGIAQIAQCINIKATDIDGILEFVRQHNDIYMTVVAPDDPLSMGLVDLLNREGYRAFGPKKAAAEIESSKVFAKNLMEKYGIPTAKYKAFDDYAAASSYINFAKYPLVIKADGLALGKGVIICSDKTEAENALKDIMLDKKFGQAGGSVVAEEFLSGFEVSVLCFTDGEAVRIMPTSRDYKRIFEGDKGPNTGGMGTFSPVPEFEPLLKKAEQEIFIPTIRALKAENRLFKGVLYFGLMVSGRDIKVLEYNARLGDPETQVVLSGLETDILDVFDACIDGTLDKIELKWDGLSRVCVIAAADGYPLDYQKGKEISISDMDSGVTVFHAGTSTIGDGKLVTSGGRVLGVTATGKTLSQAREKAYKNIKKVNFEGMYYRTDIAKGR